MNKTHIPKNKAEFAEFRPVGASTTDCSPYAEIKAFSENIQKQL